MIRSLRGMNDTLPPENRLYELFIKSASAIAKKYGFEYIQTPILEETALFKRSVGESSDIVGKEMYQFIDKGENDICLRPEGTAGVVRSFIENKLDRKGGKNRFFYYGPMFRYERPQKGRLRQFYQFGCESFGETSVYEDANVILMLRDILDSLNIKYRLKINSLGCSTCMPPYRLKLVEYLKNIEDELCEDCQNRTKTNPIRVLDCKNKSCQNSLKKAPKLLFKLCEECNSEFESLKKILDAQHVNYEIDSNLVRGLDYYSKTAFEFVSDEIGAQSSIAGGGRYDKLVEYLGGRQTAAVGFAIGVDRLLELIKIENAKEDGYYIGAIDIDSLPAIFKIGVKKRLTNSVYIEYSPRNFKKHINNADKLNMRYCAIIGENERKNGTIWVKDLVKQEEFTVLISDF